MAKEHADQPTWVDLGLPDLRTLEREFRASAKEELPPSETVAEALKTPEHHFGFMDDTQQETTIDTPIGPITIPRCNLLHIVEKRPDARERFVKLALDTLDGPFEVWKVSYDDDSHRYAFIGSYESKRQMLVVVSIWDGNVLWNFMNSEAKSLNKHRHGELVYRRYSPLQNKKGS